MYEEKRKSEQLKDEFEKFCNDIQFKQILSDDEYNEYFKDVVMPPLESSPSNFFTDAEHRDSFLAKKKVNSILFDRNKLLSKILQFIHNKLCSSSEKHLAKILEWVMKEVKDIKYNTDKISVPLENAKQAAKTNSELTNLFSFIEEYSNSQNKNKESIQTYSKKSNKKIIQQINMSDIIPHKPMNSQNFKYMNFNKSMSNPFSNTSEGNTGFMSTKKKPKSQSDDDELDLTNMSLSDDSFDKGSDSQLIYKPITPISDKIMSSMYTPEFNIFKLQKETSNCLQIVSNFIFLQKNSYIYFDYVKMDYFLAEIERGYKQSNPYHNALHAADVAQTCYIYNKYAEIESKISLSPLDISVFFLSAIIHDYKHPGFNNNYIINTQDELAIRYNDASVLENYHVSESFNLIRSNERYNIFKTFSKEEMKGVRKRIIDMVLHTDMAFHGKLMNALKQKEELKEKTENATDVKLYSIQQEYLNILLHAADISNATKPISVYVSWAERVINEFWLQGDEEKKLKLPVSFLCDRDTVTIAKSQIGFIDGVVFPYFNSLNICFDNSLQFIVDNILKNKTFYKKQKELDDMKAEIE